MFTEHRDPYTTLIPQDEEKATAALPAPPERPVLLESQRPCPDQVYERNINIGSFEVLGKHQDLKLWRVKFRSHEIFVEMMDFY